MMEPRCRSEIQVNEVKRQVFKLLADSHRVPTCHRVGYSPKQSHLFWCVCGVWCFYIQLQVDTQVTALLTLSQVSYI